MTEEGAVARCIVNSLAWYRAVLTPHGVGGAVAHGVWTSRDDLPPYYSNAVTVASGPVDEQVTSLAELADALYRVARAGITLDGAADHGVSEALYLRDPDDNGVELYWDRPQDQWPRTPDGQLAMFTRPLDVASLLRDRDRAMRVEAVGPGPRDV